MRALARVGLMLTTGSFRAAGSAGARDGLTRRSCEGPVLVTLTLVSPVEAGPLVRATVALATHSGSLGGISGESALPLRTPEGDEARPSVVEQTGGGDHRQAVVVFPGAALEKAIVIVVKNVGGVAERSFRWELPREWEGRKS